MQKPSPVSSPNPSPSPTFEELASFFPKAAKDWLAFTRPGARTPPPCTLGHMSAFVPVVFELRAMTPQMGQRRAYARHRESPMAPRRRQDQVELLSLLAASKATQASRRGSTSSSTPSSLELNVVGQLIAAAQASDCDDHDLRRLIIEKLASIIELSDSNPAAVRAIIAYFKTINDPSDQPIVEWLVTPLFRYAIGQIGTEGPEVHRQATEAVAAFIEQYNCYPILSPDDNLVYAADHLFWLDPALLKKWMDDRPDSPFVTYLRTHYGTTRELADALEIREEIISHHNCERFDFTIPYGQQALLRRDILEAVAQQIGPDDEVLLQKLVLGLTSLIGDYYLPTTERTWARELMDQITQKEAPESCFADQARLDVAVDIVRTPDRHGETAVAWANEIINNATSSPKIEVRLRAIGCLYILVHSRHFPFDTAMKMLTANAADGRQEVQIAAIKAVQLLARGNLQWAQELITRASSDREPAVRATAIGAMVQIANDPPHPALRSWAEHFIKVAAVSDPAEQVLASAIEAAATFVSGEQTIPTWVKEMVNTATHNTLQPRLRLAAVEATGKFISDLRVLPAERLWARNVIIGPRVRDENREVRASVLKSVASILSQKELSAGEMLWAKANLAILANDPDRSVRQKALALQKAIATQGIEEG